MDIIKQNRKKIQYAIFGLITLFLLIVIIIHFTCLSDFKDLRESIKELEEAMGSYESSSLQAALDTAKEAYRQALTPWIIQVICYILALIPAGLGIKQTYDECEYNISSNLLIGTVILLALGYGISNSYNASQITKMNSSLDSIYKIKVPGEIVGIIAVGFISVGLGLISFMIKEDYKNIKRASSAISSLLLFVCPCITLSFYGSDVESKYIAIEALILIIGLFSVFGTLVVDDLFVPIKHSHVAPRPTTVASTNGYQQSSSITSSSQVRPTQVTTQAPKVDAVAELKKLKDLLDQGIINEDEYNDKRKKYIDML